MSADRDTKAPAGKGTGAAEPTLRVIRCPCCKGPLYTLSTVAPQGLKGWRLTEDSPRIQNDKDGPFMRCARCSRRIAIVKERAAGAPGFEVAAGQKCDKILAPRRG